MLAYNDGAFCTTLCHITHVTSSRSWELELSSRLIPYITSTTASSFKYRIPFSMVAHLAGLNTRSSLKGYLSLLADKNHCHRIKDCAPFPIALSMPLSLKRDPSCLASLPTKSRLPAPPSQHWSNVLTRLTATILSQILQPTQH